MASFYEILETIDVSNPIGERIRHKLEDIATLDWDANGALALTNTASNIVYIKQLFHEIGTRLATRDVSHYPEVESKCNELILIANYRLQQEQPVIDLLEDLDEISKKIAVLQEDIDRYDAFLNLTEVKEIIEKFNLKE
ncbi:Oidioi.mRNA.OKI2018_I69.chr2.g7024.t1.cds [Oikopleura dioica]|uniref:Oidioi.mRNA.OKI2018_I69.chr2.g7024.t1.cds n=1 Tax=Oikopleura dioica TaxID=34765 RepID=A0ABN7T5U3_OIKDI|nr:Oidioi.mRNA.OKI2018_I69.chr2.g7024.t1.cds [Oikopleura dioica]